MPGVNVPTSRIMPPSLPAVTLKLIKSAVNLLSLVNFSKIPADSPATSLPEYSSLHSSISTGGPTAPVGVTGTPIVGSASLRSGNANVSAAAITPAPVHVDNSKSCRARAMEVLLSTSHRCRLEQETLRAGHRFRPVQAELHMTDQRVKAPLSAVRVRCHRF